MVDIQPVDKRTFRQPGENGSRTAADLQNVVCVAEAGSFKDIGSKLAGPVCLLGVASVPVHAFGG